MQYLHNFIMHLPLVKFEIIPRCDVHTAAAVYMACKELWNGRGSRWLQPWYVLMKPCSNSLRYTPSIAAQCFHLLRIPQLHMLHRFQGTAVGITLSGEMHVGASGNVQEIPGYRGSCRIGTDDLAIATISGTFSLRTGASLLPAANSIAYVRKEAARNMDVLAACTMDRTLYLCMVSRTSIHMHRMPFKIRFPDTMVCVRQTVVMYFDRRRINCVDVSQGKPLRFAQGQLYDMGSPVLWIVGPVRKCAAVICADMKARLFCPRRRKIMKIIPLHGDSAEAHTVVATHGALAWCGKIACYV